MLKRGNSFVALAVAAAVSAVSAGGAFAQAPSAARMATLDVANQKVKRHVVRIADINLPQNGYAVIHAADATGKMTDTILGYRALAAGDHKNVKVRLTGVHKAGETLWVVAQQNTGVHPGTKRDTANIGAPFMQDGKQINKSFTTM